MSSRRSLACRVALALSSLAFAAAARADDPRVVVVMEGRDVLIADLKHLCVDLAGKPHEWELHVLPNVEVFMIGIEGRRPFRYDQLIGGKTGRRNLMMVPIDNLNHFINDNLVPIGIAVRQDPQDKRLYALGGGVFNGWMRVTAGYAAFADADHPDDLPANMPAPSSSHAELWEQGYDAAARLDNSQTTPEQRSAAFAPFRENTLAGIQKERHETREAFALRKLHSEQSLEAMERLFVESSLVTIGVTVDSVNDVGIGELALSAVPDTPLADTLKRQAQQPSRFAGVVQPDNAVLAGRINCTLGEMSTRHLSQIYKLLKTPLEQQIDGTEGLTDDQQRARKQIAGIVLDILTASLDLRKWDGLAQITPQEGGGSHTGLIAIVARDSAPVAKILELLPTADSRYKTDRNVDAAGDVAIHRLTIADGYPQALQDFFGPSGELYVGAGPDTIWLGLGDGAVEAIKSEVAAAANAPGGRADPTIASLDLDLLPVLQLMNQLRKDGDFDLMATLKRLGLVEEPPPADQDSGNGDRRPDAIQSLEDYEWRDVVIEALDGNADRLHFELKRVGDRLEGEASIESGILKAIGNVIADFARQNLG